MKRPEKITFGEMREMGVRGVVIYCSDYTCSHSIAIGADQWSDPELLFVCGARGADVRPDFGPPQKRA